MARRAGFWPWGFLAVTAIYVVAGKLGLRLAFVHASATAVWPPTGIALALLLLLGQRAWPAVLLGAFLVNSTTAGNVWTSLGIACGNTLEGVAGAFLVTRFARGRDAFERAQDVFRFGVLAGFLSTTVSATLGVTSLALAGYASWSRYGAIWWTWWLGDAAGALVVAPALILWGRRAFRLKRREALDLGALLVTVSAIGAIVFDGALAPAILHQPLEFLCIPPLLWAAFCTRPRTVATALPLLSGLAVWGTLHGFGPFVRVTQNESLLLLQAFMVTLSMTLLPLAAVVAERARAEEPLARLAAIVASSREAIVSKTLDGTITSWNRAAERLLGYTAAEAVGQSIRLIIPPDRQAEEDLVLARVVSGESIENFETVRQRKDGSRVDIALTVSPVRDARGRIIGASKIAHDVTARQELEAMRRRQEALRYVTSLAAATAHEINNPLSVVVGQAELMAAQLDKDRQKRIEELLAAAWRIRDIVRRMKHIEEIVLRDDDPADLPAMLDLVKSSHLPPPPDARS